MHTYGQEGYEKAGNSSPNTHGRETSVTMHVHEAWQVVAGTVSDIVLVFSFSSAGYSANAIAIYVKVTGQSE
jgi:hypothetical protein